MLKRDDLVRVLSQRLAGTLAQDLVDDFLLLRQDVVTGTLGRANPGKLVETLVQALQALESSGKYDKKPDVDAYLRGLESRSSPLGDGLRICASRVGRAMCSLRSKRGVAHKGELDPNTIDLRFLHHAAQWVIAELVRTVDGIPMEEAGTLVGMVQAPVGGLVEDFGDRKLVLEDMTAREEALVLLHSYYPEKVLLKNVIGSMDRLHERTVRSALRALWKEKLVEGSSKDGFQLTGRGFDEAIEVHKRFV